MVGENFHLCVEPAAADVPAPARTIARAEAVTSKTAIGRFTPLPPLSSKGVEGRIPRTRAPPAARAPTEVWSSPLSPFAVGSADVEETLLAHGGPGTRH